MIGFPVFRTPVCLAAALGAGALLAAPTATTNTLVKVIDSGATSTMTLLTADCWSDGQVPHAGADYLISRTGNIRLPEGAASFDFEGNSLQVGSDSASATFYQKPASLNFKHDGLFLKKGKWGHWASNTRPKINGTVTVLSKTSAPFDFVSDNTNTGYDFTGAWHAEADCGIQVRALNAANSYDRHRLILSGDLSDFKGSISVLSRAILSVGSTRMPGSIDMVNSAPGAGGLEALHDDDVFEVDSLVLRGGAKLMPQARLATASAPATGSVFRVTGKLQVTSAPVYVVMPDALAGRGQADEMRFPVLTLAAGAEGSLNVADFAISNMVAALPPEQVALDVATDAQTGDTTLYIVRRPVVVLVTDTTGNDPRLSDGKKGNWGAFSQTNYWSDAQIPHPGVVYDTNGKVCRTCYDAAKDEFLGDALIVSGGSLVLQSKEVVLPRTYVRTSPTGSSPSLSHWHANGDKTVNTFAKGGTKVLRGGPMVVENQFNSSFSSVDSYLRFDIPFEGPGQLNWAMEANQPAGNAYLEFAADNSNWTGILTITAKVGTQYRTEHTYTNTMEVCFREARNLGGPRASFHSGALSLNGMTVLHPLQTVTLDEPTRGVQIATLGAGIRTDVGTVLTIRQRLMLQGVLTKFGAGTLALGGTVSFGNASTFAPGSTIYPVDVQEGGIKAVATDALNGATLRFGADGALLADPAATGDVAAYGLYDVQTDTPFDRANCPDGKVPVRVELEEDFADHPHVVADVPVCTVSAAAAENLGVDAFVVRRPKGCSAAMTARVNDDGTVTYLATIGPGGLVFLVK